jgi:2-hydroxy-3-keto-5-methylthiopentenyl-1-phosphate phosphatase
MSSPISVPNEQVVFTDFDGTEGILVDLNTKKYYQLNETAMLVWKALEKRKSLGEIVNDVTETYDVSHERATESVERLLQSMRMYKLVS